MVLGQCGVSLIMADIISDQTMLLLTTACAVLMFASPALPSVTDQSPICAKSCKCLGPWAKCISGKIEELPGHFGPQIETMSLQSYNIPVIEANAFSGIKLPNFWKLDILQCGILTIKKHAFNGLQDLLSLHLDNNKIEEIEPGAFLGLLKLNSLTLQHNKIKTLEYGVFEGLENLKSLNLNNNLLKSLKPKIFEEMQTLTTILLKENQIKSIDSSVLEGLNEAAQLYVHKNPLVCNCSLKKEWPLIYKKIIGATCSSPQHLKGYPLNVLQGVNCDYDDEK